MEVYFDMRGSIMSEENLNKFLKSPVIWLKKEDKALKENSTLKQFNL